MRIQVASSLPVLQDSLLGTHRISDGFSHCQCYHLVIRLTPPLANGQKIHQEVPRTDLLRTHARTKTRNRDSNRDHHYDWRNVFLPSCWVMEISRCNLFLLYDTRCSRVRRSPSSYGSRQDIYHILSVHRDSIFCLYNESLHQSQINTKITKNLLQF